MKKFLIFTLLISLTSCGGGSSEQLIQNLEGKWSGNLVLVLDEYFLKVNPLSEVHEISIDGDEIILISTDNRTLQGKALSNDSFQAEISDGAAFPNIDRVSYNSINAKTAQVEVSHVYSRPGGCVTTWKGKMKRIL